MRKYTILALLLSLSTFAFSQNAKIINKDFDIEAYDTIEFDLYGETIYEPWEADYVLVETTVKLWDTPKNQFLDHIRRGRYYCHIKNQDSNAKIESIPVERNKLTARESVVSIVYYPINFVLNNSKIVRQNTSVSSKEEE